MRARLPYPEEPYSTTIRLSAAEIEVRKLLAKRYGASPAAVLVVALFELYKRQPVDVSVAPTVQKVSSSTQRWPIGAQS
jgi:hypothetical protein